MSRGRRSIPRPRALLALPCAALALLILTPVAAAAPRFASPTGSGTQCSQAQPCDIVTAVGAAAEGDDVTIGPGTYGAPTPLTEAVDDEERSISIHGQAGQPPPLVISQANYVFELVGKTSSLSHVAIESAQAKYGVFVNASNDVAIDHVFSHVSAPGAVACYPSGTITNSVCWSSGPNGIAATMLISNSATATLRNDTLIASGPGGVAARAAGVGSSMTIDLVNSIARGAGTDIVAKTTPEPKSAAIVNATYSNYATVQVENEGGGSTTSVTPAGSGANQTGAPVFRNAASGDFRQTGNSIATIDRGENNPLDGATDLDGTTRSLPGSYGCGTTPPSVTDIGAYEYMSAIPTCVSPFPHKPKISKTKVNRRKGKLTFTFGVADATAGFQCSLVKLGKGKKKKAKASFARCKSPKTYRRKPGKYRFEVRALNAAGAGAAAVKTVKLKSPPRG